MRKITLILATAVVAVAAVLAPAVSLVQPPARPTSSRPP